MPTCREAQMQLFSPSGFHVLRPYGLLADDPSREGLWFAGRDVMEVLMEENPRTGLDREKVLLWTAILGFLKVVAEIVIKAVSYARGNSQLLVLLQAQR